MMLGVSGLMGSSGDGAAAAEAHESGGASGGSSEVGASSSIPGGGGGGMEESERSGGGGGGGNRWPRQETLALLKIRSEMDVTFRDSSLKGPLWEEVSRKMAELGFQRNPKKCKEKFENVYKYHKRTKDGRSSKSDGAGGKTYRFFDQLEALENTTTTTPPPPHLFTTAAAPPPPRPPPLMLTSSTAAAAAALPMPPTVSSSNIIPANINNNPIINSSSFQPSSGQPPPLQHHLPPPQPPPPPSSNTVIPPQGHAFQHSAGGRPHMMPTRQLSDSTSNSSTSSDEDIQRRRRGRKRKWKDFFERVMKDVINKQEDLQKRFLDTLEKRERDRTAREDAWRLQEITRLNREHDLLVQERSIAAAKDAAVISFLQKVTDQHNLQIPIGNIFTAPPPPLPQVPPVQIQPPQIPQPPRQQQPPSMQLSTIPPQPQPPAAPPTTKPAVAAPPAKIMDIVIADNGGRGDNSMSSAASSSRWPKAEVEALIKLRTNLDIKYQENGPKGPLWEEISSAMAKIGYNRSSKRCKEKWENINKYFKKVKESNKKRPEDSKTCPYFHQLDAIYRERGSKSDVVSFPGYGLNPDNNNPMILPPPIMARPEQQWPLLPPDEQRQPPDQFQDNESDHDEEEDDGDGDEDDEEDEAQCFEIVTNKQQPSSVTTTTNAAD